MKAKHLFFPMFAALTLAAPLSGHCQDKPDKTAPEWSQLETSTKQAMNWRPEKEPASQEEAEAAFKKMVAGMQNALDQVNSYVAANPKGEHTIDAKLLRTRIQLRLVQFGNADVASDLIKNIDELLQAPELPSNRKPGLEINRLTAELATLHDQEESEKRWATGLLALIQKYPSEESICRYALQAAQDSESVDKEIRNKLATAVANSPAADENAKKEASDFLSGKMFSPKEALGKPLDIQFTAMDGRKVDLAAMKGKVVLIDFWATWCGPCREEIPNVKAAYEKFHDKGFEVIGISCDQSKQALEKFVKEKGMPWPQYFAEDPSKNEFADRFHIRGIPTMWLVGKDGNFADQNGRSDLAKKVEDLLNK